MRVAVPLRLPRIVRPGILFDRGCCAVGARLPGSRALSLSVDCDPATAAAQTAAQRLPYFKYTPLDSNQ